MRIIQLSQETAYQNVAGKTATHTWVHVFMHMPEVQVFCDKFYHVLLLDFIGNWFKITVFQVFPNCQLAPMHIHVVV